LFKKPGSDPAGTKIIKLTRDVGSVVPTTGKTWQGPNGGEWVELDSARGEKKGWLLVEGPGFGVPGPMLAKAEAGETALLLRTCPLLRETTDDMFTRVCLKPSENVATLKAWIAMRFPKKMAPEKILVAKQKPTEDEMDQMGSFPAHKWHTDGTKLGETGWSPGDEVYYFYMGELEPDAD